MMLEPRPFWNHVLVAGRCLVFSSGGGGSACCPEQWGLRPCSNRARTRGFTWRQIRWPMSRDDRGSLCAHKHDKSVYTTGHQ